MANVPPTRLVTFIENQVPPLPAGAYTLTVAQTVTTITTPGPYINDSSNESYNFAVAGERFSLDDADVLSVFPPIGPPGDYFNALPQVVLSRRTFAWERRACPTDPDTTWLAILLFYAGENVPAIQQVRMIDLTHDEMSTLPPRAVSYGEGKFYNGAAFGPEYGERWQDPCQAIDIPFDQFSAIAPTYNDLAWLAHVRSFSLQQGTDPATPDGEYSVIVGNRLPPQAANTTTVCTAHLVSLEGMSDFLPTEGAEGNPVPFQWPGGDSPSLIRLVSLMSWQFGSIDLSMNFQDYLQALDVDQYELPYVGVASTAPQLAVQSAFQLGYTAFDHSARQGDTTVSWYRGPFVPFSVGCPLSLASPITSADSLVRYDPNTGMMDVSYAAAWEIGRLMGLASKSFSVPFYEWRKAAKRNVARTAVHEEVIRRYGGMLPLSPPGAPPTWGVQLGLGEFLAKALAPLANPEEPA